MRSVRMVWFDCLALEWSDAMADAIPLRGRLLPQSAGSLAPRAEVGARLPCADKRERRTDDRRVRRTAGSARRQSSHAAEDAAGSAEHGGLGTERADDEAGRHSPKDSKRSRAHGNMFQQDLANTIIR
jgi:hypothetical protein